LTVLPCCVAVDRDLIHRSAGCSTIATLFKHVRVFLTALTALTARLVIALFNQQPIFTAAASPALYLHQRPAAAQFVAVKFVAKIPVTKIAFNFALSPSLIPELDRAPAILALRNKALETAVFECMILDLHRQTLFTGFKLGVPWATPSFSACPPSPSESHYAGAARRTF
jgi:hypothetical protein